MQSALEFAQSMKHIVDLYPKATVSRVALDNLNMHKMASLYEAFPAEQARELARKLAFHHTPKHGSWLNIAEIELAVLSNVCLSRRIPGKDRPTPRGRSQCPGTQCESESHAGQMAFCHVRRTT